MKAILTAEVRKYCKYVSDATLLNTRDRALQFVRTGRVRDTNVGLCSNINARDLIEVMTGTCYPIKGYVWETSQQAYANTVFHGRRDEKYKGHQLKQRRKLAIKLINVIDQYMKETS